MNKENMFQQGISRMKAFLSGKASGKSKVNNEKSDPISAHTIAHSFNLTPSVYNSQNLKPDGGVSQTMLEKEGYFNE